MNRIKTLVFCIMFSLAFALIGAVSVNLYYGWTAPKTIYSGDYSKYLRDDVELVIFTRESCIYCHQLEQFLVEHGVPYFKYDVDASEQGRAYFAEINQQGTPLILFQDSMILGFQPDIIAKKLNLPKVI